MPIDLCPHKMNPVSCPTCYRTRAAQPKPKVEENLHPGIPVGVVVPIGEATIRATQNAARAKLAPMRGSNTRPLKEPYSSAHLAPPPEAHSNDKVWEPPNLPDLIDRQPTHPHLHESVTKVR